MHIHILGICGTFMGGLAQLALAAGHRVSGCDANVYPPMSEQLEAAGVRLIEGYARDQLTVSPDLWIVGNVVTRGNPLMEAILDRGLPFVSGPQWLANHVLAGRHVLGVAGTHGKTTTTAMLAMILEQAGFAPGFLVGGVPSDFGVSARLGSGRHFVIEADEYDTAFFDKRSKFLHYRPHTAIFNNLEFDHADIFPDLASDRDAIPPPGADARVECAADRQRAGRRAGAGTGARPLERTRTFWQRPVDGRSRSAARCYGTTGNQSARCKSHCPEHITA